MIGRPEVCCVDIRISVVVNICNDHSNRLFARRGAHAKTTENASVDTCGLREQEVRPAVVSDE
jgi:hypothetical protein